MRQFGFTLIECLLYLAIFSVFMTGLVVALGHLNYRLLERERDFTMLRDQQFLFDKIEWFLNTASTITVTSGSVLEIQQETETFQLRLMDERLFVMSESHVPEPLSPTYLKVNDFAVSEEIVGTSRQVTVTYVAEGKTISHHVYVPL
jgi:prepilin-type N-terminal cleavage/methylation domain-containing protein